MDVIESVEEGGQPAPKVLLIDDEPDIRELYAAHLKQEYRVLTASSGDVSLEVIRDEIDVILSDRHMSGTSGDELLERLRDHDIDTPVILVSAIDPGENSELPCQAYLTKPVSGAELRRHVAAQTTQASARAGD